jgi:hypothetical protein
MDLGSYKEDLSKPIKWFSKMPYSQFWQSTLTGFMLGAVSLKKF